MVNHLNMIVLHIVQLTDTVGFVTFYEFLQEFVKIFAKVIMGERIVAIFKACVSRIVKDIQKKQQAGAADTSTVVIDKCCNILRISLESNIYMPTLKAEFEENLRPIYQYMADPSKISFEDDIILMLKSQIRKRKEITPTMWELFQQFPKVLEKNKHAFGNLFETINYFLIVGKVQLAQQTDNLKILYLMADTALFTKNPNQTINNTEGAVMVQLLFQLMTGSEALDEIFREVLDRVC